MTSSFNEKYLNHNLSNQSLTDCVIISNPLSKSTNAGMQLGINDSERLSSLNQFTICPGIVFFIIGNKSRNALKVNSSTDKKMLIQEAKIE